MHHTEESKQNSKNNTMKENQTNKITIM